MIFVGSLFRITDVRSVKTVKHMRSPSGEMKMIVYEYSTLKVNVADLEDSLTEYSKAGWEIINIREY